MDTNIAVIVDIAAALAAGELRGNIYLVDGNKSAGSKGEGTEGLQTAINVGDTITWSAWGLQVETKVRIESFSFPAGEVIDVVRGGNAIAGYTWSGKVKKGFSGVYQYNLNLRVESRKMSLTTLPSLNVQ